MCSPVLNSIISGNITLTAFLLCALSSAVLGVLTALLFRWRSSATPSFSMTLALLPLAVQTVILLVNGNLGVGVAVAGTFSLIRFRSAPGSGREIAAVFIAMALGLATGMGYLGLAFLFFALTALFVVLLNMTRFGESRGEERMLKITIPENLDYDGLFDDLFAKYAQSASLDKVKTASMGTLYELHYLVRLPQGEIKKDFIDALRARNGNLPVTCGRVPTKDQL